MIFLSIINYDNKFTMDKYRTSHVYYSNLVYLTPKIQSNTLSLLSVIHNNLNEIEITFQMRTSEFDLLIK